MSPATAEQVLIVEDDFVIRESLSEALIEEGFAVTTAGHGGEALTLLRSGLRPSVMLLDLMMPIMDGWQLLSILREDQDLSRIPVIVVSAARERHGPAGAAAFLNKPISLDVLLQQLQVYCARGVPPSASAAPP